VVTTQPMWQCMVKIFIEFIFNLLSEIISELQTMGHIVLPPNKKFLHQPLQCNKCDYFTNDIKQLKSHLKLIHNLPQIIWYLTFKLYLNIDVYIIYL